MGAFFCMYILVGVVIGAGFGFSVLEETSIVPALIAGCICGIFWPPVAILALASATSRW